MSFHQIIKFFFDPIGNLSGRISRLFLHRQYNTWFPIDLRIYLRRIICHRHIGYIRQANRLQTFQSQIK